MNPPLPNEVLLAPYGPQDIPMLGAVTQILGTGSNALQAILTAGLKTPYKVSVKINGLTQFWTAEGGTDATDVPNGIVQAVDFNQTGVVWYLTS